MLPDYAFSNVMARQKTRAPPRAGRVRKMRAGSVKALRVDIDGNPQVTLDPDLAHPARKGLL